MENAKKSNHHKSHEFVIIRMKKQTVKFSDLDCRIIHYAIHFKCIPYV